MSDLELTTVINVPAEIQAEIELGALFFINHSGGKDSQAMAAMIRAIVPEDQIVVIHAKLPRVDWKGTEEHARATTVGLPFVTRTAPKTFFDMIEHRGMFPDRSRRQCTSDLKRGPMEVVIRREMKARGQLRAVNCLGLRAEESQDRAKKAVVQTNGRLSKAGRTVIDWLPIHHLLIGEVFAIIAMAGQEPHWAYKAGMSRLSCCFCIMSSKADLLTAARLNPLLAALYIGYEHELGHTLQQDRPLSITLMAA